MTMMETQDTTMTAAEVVSDGGDVGEVATGLDGAPPLEEEVAKDETESEAPKKADEDIARRFAALARKERAVQERERAFKEQLRSDPEYLEFQRFKKARESSDYREKLQYLGTDYNRITKAMLGEKEEEEKDPATLAMERVEALERQLAEREEQAKKQAADAEEQERQKIEAAAKMQIRKEVEGDPDKYELINLNDAHDMVYDVILEWYLKNHEILPTSRAAELVEQHFEKELEAKLGKSKKIRAKLLPTEQAIQQGEGEQARATDQVKSPKTISARTVAQGTSVNETRGYLSDEESKRLIAEKLRTGAYKRG